MEETNSLALYSTGRHDTLTWIFCGFDISWWASQLLLLLDQVFHPQTGGCVLLILTLGFCGPVLKPGVLAEYIPKPEETSSLRLHGFKGWHFMLICYLTYSSVELPKQWKKGRITVTRVDHTQPAEKPTIPCALSSKDLWISPWPGRFSLSPSSKSPDILADWGNCAVDPARPRQHFLQKNRRWVHKVSKFRRIFHKHIRCVYVSICCSHT